MLLWSLVVAVQTSERAGRELAGSPTAMPGTGYRDRDREGGRTRFGVMRPAVSVLGV